VSYFDQYSGAAAQDAAQFGIPQDIFFGMIQTESNWNPFAVGDSGQAIGFGQLHAGAATDVGVNRFDPLGNLQGAAAYLSQQYHKFGNWTDALAAYNQGSGATGQAWQNGLSYAQKVLNAAKGFMTGDNAVAGAECATGNPMGCIDLGANVLGLGGGDSCAWYDIVCKLEKWEESTHFFQRISIAILAFLFVLGGLYLYKQAQ